MFKDYQPKKKDMMNTFLLMIFAKINFRAIVFTLGEMGLDQLDISHEIVSKLFLRHGATFCLNETQ